MSLIDFLIFIFFEHLIILLYNHSVISITINFGKYFETNLNFDFILIFYFRPKVQPNVIKHFSNSIYVIQILP